MKKYLTPFLLVVLLPGLSFSQKIKMTRIIDTNLFELEDGRIVKMAGLDTPNKDCQGENMSELTESIIEYAKSNLAKRSLEIIPVSHKKADSSYSLVYIIQHYPLGMVDHNKKYLELGYGKFFDNVDSLHRDEYQKAAHDAINNKRHLWSFRLPDVSDTLDKAFAAGPRLYDNSLASLYYIQFLRKRGTPVNLQIAGQAVLGAGLGIAGAVTFPLVFVGLSFQEGWDAFFPAMIGLGFGYLTGTSYGVYFAAKPNNPALSYWNTLAFSTICTMGSVSLAYSFDWKEPVMNWVCVFMPLISPIIYANSIAPNPVREVKAASRDFNLDMGTLAFKDHNNRTIRLKINLLQVKF